MADPAYSTVISFPLASGNEITKFSLVSAEVAKNRFLHIPSLLDSQEVKIVTTEQKLPESYACVSYVWSNPYAPKGNASGALISVEGLSDAGDYTSVAILKAVCVAARQVGTELLWFDKFCVRQDTTFQDKTTTGWKDKNWQMLHMGEVYSQCKVCIVAPGGLLRLPEINERTPWIDRAWTLQEALGPKDVQVLFKWSEGNMVLQHISFVEVTQVADGVGMSPLKGLLEASLRSSVKVINEDTDWDTAKEIEVNVFVKRDETVYPVMALLGALDHGDKDGRLNAIWRCLLIRSARYKEDMIFSSMGIMGAPVEGKDQDKDAAEYKAREEVETYELLVKFLKALIAKGNNKAEWLGIAPNLGPSTIHSGLPALPLPSNVGAGFVLKDGKYIVPNLAANGSGFDNYWWLKDSPAVDVHDNGDALISAKAAPVEESQDTTKYEGYIVQKETPDRLVHCSTRRAWNLTHDAKNAAAYAVYVGFKVQYLNGNLPVMMDETSSLLMLVKEVEPGKYKNVGYAWGDDNITNGWEDMSFTLV